MLLFTDTAKIKGAIVDAGGVKTLTLTPVTGETPTPAEFAAALSSVKFANTSDTPDATARSITFKVTDNEGQASTVLTEMPLMTHRLSRLVLQVEMQIIQAFTESDGPDANNNHAFTNGTTNLVDLDSDITDVKISIASNK